MRVKGVQRSTLAVWIALVTFCGCDLTAPSVRKPDPTVIGSSGRLVEVKRCALTVAILTGTREDTALGEGVWQVADEQVVSPELRQALSANGLRVGRISGEPPVEIQAMLRQGPPNPPGVSTIVNPVGQGTLIDPTQAAPQAAITLLLSQPGGSVKGKPYEQAKGFLRLTPTFEGSNAIALRVSPEVHHGPVERRYGQLPDGGVAAPAEFQIQEKQKEDSFRELAASVSLEPGQVLVLGSRPERSGTLGSLVFQKTEGESDRVLQCVVLIWATRAETAPADAKSPGMQIPPALWPVLSKPADTKADARPPR